MKTPGEFSDRPMLPFPFSNGEDFLQVDWTGTMSISEGMQGYLAYWYKTGRVKNVWRKPAPLARIGFLIENPEGLEFPASGRQSFDPETGILVSGVHYSESIVMVESFLRGAVWVQAVRFAHAAPGARLCFTANQRVLFRLCAETPLSEVSRYRVDGDSIAFSYACDPECIPPPNMDFIPSFRGTGRLAAWSDDGQAPVPELDIPCHHFLNPPNGGLWLTARTGGTCVAFAVLMDNLSTCGDSHESASREELDTACRKGFGKIRAKQEAFWRGYQAQGSIRLLEDDATTYFAQASVYGLKSALHERGAIPCSLFLPVLGGDTYWDSWGMASGLLRMNHPEDAKRIGRYFLRALPKAREHASLLNAEGARLEWDLWPPPFEGMCPRAPRKQIHNCGTHLNTIWDAYSFTGDLAYLQEVFPVIDETVRFYLSYAVESSADGVHIRPVQSLDENPALRKDDTWTLAVIIRSLEIHRLAAGALGLKAGKSHIEIEKKLRARLEQNYLEGVLQGYSGCRRINLGSVLPFRVLEDLPGADKTLAAYVRDSSEAEGLGLGPYTHARGKIFPWIHGMVAAAMNRQGVEDVWEKVLNKVPRYTDHLGGSAELWLHSRQISYPWYLGSHGFFLSSLAELIGNERGGEFQLLAGIPPSWRDFEFENIRMNRGLLVSGAVEGGRVRKLRLCNGSVVRIGDIRWSAPGLGRQTAADLEPGEGVDLL